MKLKTHTTGKYEIQLTFTVVERNPYGDLINDNVITWNGKTEVTSLRELGELLERVDGAIHEPG
jgi:hypothetical protein